MADDPYEVGYGKPPKHTRFQPGRSGNPTGQRKPRPSVSDRLNKILAERVSVADGGRQMRLPKEDVFLRQLVNKAISGDRQFSRMLLDHLQRDHERPAVEGLGATDAYLMEELLKMVDARGEEP